MINITKIYDFDVPELDIYARLNEAQLLHYFEPSEGLFIAESSKVIERVLNAGYEPFSMLAEEKHLTGEAAEIIKTLSTKTIDFPVYTADFDVLTKLSGYQFSRGALCAFRRKPLKSLDEICQSTRRIVILEDVVNPTNIGAIFRSAAALNMDSILLTPNCCDPLYRRSIRVSMGTVFQIPWTYFNKYSNLADDGIPKLKNLGFKTVAMALKDNSVSIDDTTLLSEEKLAIILGTEGEGLNNSTIDQCDYTVKIPMSHGVDSLNVAAASAVAFWQLGKI